MQDEPIVESPSCAQFQHSPEKTYSISSEEIAVYTITEEYSGRKLSADLCKKDEFKEAVKLDEDDSEADSLSHPDRPSKLLDISSSVDIHIKSEILREEIDQSIEESPLEVKQIAEDLQSISSSEDHKCNVYKHIRTEIFTQVLGEDIESGSPERKEISVLSTKSDSNLDEVEIADHFDTVQHDQETCALDKIEDTSEVSGIKSDHGDLENKFHKDLSPQISQESVGQTDEMSSEGIVVEQDEHLVDYEEALAEHSLTEQLQALASDYSHPVFNTSDFEQEEYNSEHKSPAMSSSMSDLEIHRRAKDLYSRHDKKEIRSLKSTKQVSTIEEHSSIESCDSPQELMLQDFSEKHALIESSEQEKSSIQDKYEDKKDLADITSSESTKSDGELKSSKDEKDDSLEKSLQETEASDKVDISLKQSDVMQKTDRLPRSDSKSSQGKKSDSDAEGSKGESIAESSVKRKEESFSSSGETESPYYSVETSDSGKTPRSTPAASRPCSSEFDINVFSGQGSEYETCVTSQEASGEASGSYVTAISSQEISYATACSSFSHSSRESAYSVDSESSGHLASVEISSEASETLVPSAQEMELEFGPDLEMPVLDEEPSNEDSLREPYDMDIPESVIRGGIEMPFMKTWGMKPDSTSDDDKINRLSQQWPWQYAAESEVLDKFEILENSDSTVQDQTCNNLPVANVQTVEECTSRVTTVTDTAKSFTHVETVSSVHEGPGHRRSFSSVFDIVPERENVEQPVIIEEEQLSVSESSATHSEQTWQTNSIDTAIQLSSQAPASCLINESSSLFSASDSFQETPPEKELTSEQSSSALQPESYLQLNGPVEVEYNPDYDNPDVDNSELNNEQQVSHYDVDGLQFDLEIDGTFNNVSNGSNTTAAVVNAYTNNTGNETVNSVVPSNYEIHPSTEYESHTVGASSDAEKPEAQQEQSLNFNDYRTQRETESLVCPDLTSYLPESDQCDLLSVGDSLPPSYESEVNIPCSESSTSNELPAIENKSQLLPDLQSTDSMERTDVVDTSPEDERYEYKSVKSAGNEKYIESKELEVENASSMIKCDEGDILAESDYIPPSYTSKYDEPPSTELYTHHEEEEFELRESDVYPSPIPSVEDDKQSTPSSDVLHRRFFPRSGDTSAASSLQEFERLEAEIAAGRLSRSSIDSSEKVAVTKSGEHDDISMSSLTEFEKLEKECVDNDSGDKIGEDIMLSEIEEGLESQCSDVLEILPESLHEGSDSSEYEKRRLDIEEIIKVTESNVEKFQEETLSEAVTSDECTVLMRVMSETQDTSEGTKVSSKEEGVTDAEESEPYPVTLDADNTGGPDSSSSGEKNYGNGRGDCMVSSTDSIDPSSSTATHATYQFETDSVMSSSINSAQASGEECTMVSSTDTLEPEPKITYSHGGVTHDEKVQSACSTDSSVLKKGSLECKLEELKQLESTNGAKEQMEMFLSKLTDESVLMDDFPPHSFSDTVDDSEQHSSDDLAKSHEAAQGFSTSGS